jgi:hypothetical protein
MTALEGGKNSNVCRLYVVSAESSPSQILQAGFDTQALNNIITKGKTQIIGGSVPLTFTISALPLLRPWKKLTLNHKFRLTCDAVKSGRRQQYFKDTCYFPVTLRMETVLIRNYTFLSDYVSLHLQSHYLHIHHSEDPQNHGVLNYPLFPSIYSGRLGTD